MLVLLDLRRLLNLFEPSSKKGVSKSFFRRGDCETKIGNSGTRLLCLCHMT